MTKVIFSLLAVATWYDPHAFTDDVYCQKGLPDAGTPWVAVDVEHYLRGTVQCGDWLAVQFESGETLLAQALDAGPLGLYFIRDWPDLAIALDVPERHWPFPSGVRSARVTEVVNISKTLKRVLKECCYVPQTPGMVD